MPASAKTITRQLVFWGVIVLIVATNWVSAPIALSVGLLLGLTLGNPFTAELSKVTRFLLQASVVGLGFGINLHQVAETGVAGLVCTAVSLGVTLLLGLLLAKLLGVEDKLGSLISAGTAICGGSAIAAVAPAIGASGKDISVALGVVFVLNAVALFLFPYVGLQFHLSQQQFGVWAAIAIHDTSSVVGAATLFGDEALQVATTLKLTRALWIIPVTVAAGLLYNAKGKKLSFPLFILLFVVASVISTFLPNLGSFYSAITLAARKGLIVSLFFIGAGINLPLLRTISFRPFLHGVALWLIVAIASLLGVLYFVQ